MKYAAEYLFPVVSEPIRNGYVEVDDDGKVIAIGRLKSGDDVEIHKGFIVPGFVNAHCHLELSHLKGLFKEATGMDGFIQQINSLRSAVDRDGRIARMAEEMENLWNQGVSAMADISNCSESFELKSKSPLYTRTFLEVFGTEPEDAPAIIDEVVKLQQTARGFGLDAAPTPHSCYTMSPLLNRLAAAEGLKDGFISYHSQESDEEEDLLRYGKGALYDDYSSRGTTMLPVTGTSALVYFIDNLLKEVNSPVDGHVLLVHNVATDRDSIDRALELFKNCYWALCPLSNIFIHRALPPVELMREKKLNICIGTDSLSSNKLLSMVAEMFCLQENFKDLPFAEILQWATLNGARFLAKEEQLGSFRPGLKPGVVLIENVDVDNIRLTPESISKRII